MKYESLEVEKRALYAVADLMMLAARTAPKGRGLDNIRTLVIDGAEKDALSAEMRKIANETGAEFFARDAKNVDNSPLVVFVGVINEPVGLDNCSFCGFENCGSNKKSGGRCAFNITDLGVALGSAASVSATHKADSRIMFSAGKAALNLKYLPENVKVCYGIPLSSTSKSIYFDRDSVVTCVPTE